jgi:hypothetical protein
MTIVGPHLAAQPPIERPTSPALMPDVLASPSARRTAPATVQSTDYSTVSKQVDAQANPALGNGIVLAGPSRVANDGRGVLSFRFDWVSASIYRRST